jgi:FKBP-type peptidyl-prolyl cis-trans isomerase (trigger factor)
MNIISEETSQNTLQITLEIPIKDTKSAKDKALKNLAIKTTIKGFRQGKAPLSLVEKSLDPDKIKHETLHLILDSILPKIVKDKNLNLVGNPKLIKIEDTISKPWQITLSFPLKPQIKLGNYTQLIKDAISKNKEKFDKLNRDEKVDFISDILIKNIDFEVPQSLIDQEVDRGLSRLIEQTENLGLSLDRYLTSISKTVEQLREEQFKKATESLKFEFILLEIATIKKTKIKEDDIDTFIKGFADKTLEERFKKPSERVLIESILLKRSVIDDLLKI